MNEQRFTVHINFVKGNENEFTKKNMNRHIDDFHLDFFYHQDFYKRYLIYRSLRDKQPECFMLARLHTTNESLMEEFKNKFHFLLRDLFSPKVYHNNLLISTVTRQDLPAVDVIDMK